MNTNSQKSRPNPTGRNGPNLRTRNERGASKPDCERKASPKSRSASQPSRSSRRELRERFEALQRLPLEYIASQEFDGTTDPVEILAPMPERETATRRVRPPSGLPAYVASLYEVPLLSKGQEQHLFRKYNFLKHEAAALREQIDPRRPSVRKMDQIDDFWQQAVAIKNHLIRSNLRLVISIAKRYAGGRDQLFELVSDGNESLMSPVERFDYSLGFRFSTYATWAIKKNFASQFKRQQRLESHYRSGHEDLLDAEPEEGMDEHLQLAAQQQREQDVARIMTCLTDRERAIVSRRFGLASGAQAQTLKQVAEEFGVSKERIRQIEQRSLAKLREAAEAKHLDYAAA